MDANPDNTYIPDETIKAIEDGKPVRVGVALFRDATTGWPAVAMEPQFWEHLVSKVVVGADECSTCRTFVECMLHEWMEWKQEPEGWIPRFRTANVD